ncbi:hypothetical protein PZA11_003913 [Diplocarpon coronariae]|uniref:AB hydrolase-1 domain-containing protein n=1 Tax=Diplocarpon coronariae TaxID=2795749 RepID=A0A218ZF94_9HELO|nr:alpha/beta hydrolase [Diplocarpon mali]OWP06761.1 hypothetical protein B2J93_8818 [Marssonina coronariae]
MKSTLRAAGEQSGLVSIGSHSLWLTVAGPDREPGQPVVLIIQGLASCAASWAAVIRLLGAFIRVYAYDRSGLGKSEPSSLAPTSANIVVELRMLLEAAHIDPPYVIIGHSWGGVLSREFIVPARIDDIAGIVLVEANQERTLEELDWRPFFNWILENGVDIQNALDLKARSKLTAAEWDQYQADDAKSYVNGQAVAEQAQYAESFGRLTADHQSNYQPPFLGSKKLSVVKGDNARDLRKLYDAVVRKNAGTEEERIKFREFLATFSQVDMRLQSELRKLSSNTRIVYSSGSGHNVQLTDPEIIIDMVKWVVADCQEIGRLFHS